MDGPTITVKYSCLACGIRRRSVEIAARGDESILDWMNKVVIIGLSADHDARSPHCRPETLSEVMIPTTGTDKIGGAIKH